MLITNAATAFLSVLSFTLFYTSFYDIIYSKKLNGRVEGFPPLSLRAAFPVNR